VDDDLLREIYGRVSLFAMPSRGEGFGIVYLEAMAHRLACIGSIFDAAGELIADGESGFLVDPNNLEGMAARIVQLLKDASLRAEFGETGYRRLQEHFSPERFHTRFADLMRNLSQMPVPA
jgi:phosphatidylinositol alpha-1,6-mannosyltransferase